jgi:hypothetical protein
MQQALRVRGAVLWSVAASRATDTSSLFARPASPVSGGAAPQIVSIRPLQRVSCGGMSIANVFALRLTAQTP